MKKNYLFLAAATTLFAACVQTDVVTDIPEPQQQAISFETFANKQTRAENSSATNYNDLSNHHENFYVWGYKDVQPNAYVFDEKTVSYLNSNWSYTGLAYWDKAASSYEFYAASPASENIWTLNKKVENKLDDYFTIGVISQTPAQSIYYTVTTHNASTSTTINQVTTFDCSYKESFKRVADAVDLMIAAPKNVPNGSFGQIVQLDFIHILSRLNITVSKDKTLANQTVVLKSLTLSNVNNQGTFDESKVPTSSATLATGTYERWTTNNVVTTYSSLSDVTLKYVSNETPTPNGAIATPEYMLQALIMPQTAGVQTVKLDGTSENLTEPYFTIVYTITDNDNTEEFSASYNLASAFGITETNSLSFNEGWQNTLNITIKPTAIVFTAKAAVWADHDFAPDDDTSLGGDIEIE